MDQNNKKDPPPSYDEAVGGVQAEEKEEKEMTVTTEQLIAAERILNAREREAREAKAREREAREREAREREAREREAREAKAREREAREREAREAKAREREAREREAREARQAQQSKETSDSSESGNGDTLSQDEIGIVIREQRRRDGSRRSSIAEAEANKAEEDKQDAEELSPDEVAIVLRMQDERQSYLPSHDRRRSFEEAMEMIDKDGANGEAEVTPSTARDVARQAGMESETRFQSVDAREVDAEEGRRNSSRREIRGMDILRHPKEYLSSLSQTRLVILTTVAIGFIGLIVFLGVFPNSFVYLEYHNVALKQSKMTNYVDRDTVYYPGCYVLGPDTKFIRFQATSHDITETMNVFTSNSLSIRVTYSLQYFLRAAEVGQLYSMFIQDYDPFIRSVVISSIRNYAATELTVDQFRFNRTEIERKLHTALRLRLGGDCCPECCPDGCQSNKICSVCNNQGSCDQGYHIDVRYFYMLTVLIPDEVFDKYLRRTLQDIETEREVHYQNYKVFTKKTKQITEKIRNEGLELIAEANAEASKIRVKSEAEKEKLVQISYAHALKDVYNTLNITDEDRKVSYMLVRTLKDVEENLRLGYGYDRETIFNGP